MATCVCLPPPCSHMLLQADHCHMHDDDSSNGVMQLRTRVWPVLLGAEGISIPHDEYMQWAHGSHPDSTVVDCDVQRSLWSYTKGEAAKLVLSNWQLNQLNILVAHS